MASRRAKAPRDTAKDIILGIAPSGAAPRQPKEGVSTPKPKDAPKPTAPVTPTVVVDRRPDNTAIVNLQFRLEQLQKENKDLLQAEQNARRKLEENQQTSSRNYEEVQKQTTALDGKFLTLSNDLNSLRSQLDNQANDVRMVSNEIKSRPIVDPSKTSSSSQFEGEIRDLHSQLMELKRTNEQGKLEKERDFRMMNEQVQRLQEIIQQQEKSKEQMLTNLARKGDLVKEKISEHSRKIDEKIRLITEEVARNTRASQSRLQDEISQRFNAFEASLRLQSDKLLELERKIIDGEQTKSVDSIAKQFQNEKSRNKNKFIKVNEALAELEKHLEKGNRKMNKMLRAEIEARQLHEKGMLMKIEEVDDHLHNHIVSLKKSIEEVKAGKGTRVPDLDIDALRREIEVIASDKNKLSIEALLKLEKRMSDLQEGIQRDKTDLYQQLAGLDENGTTKKLKGQMGKLDSVQEDMDKTQARIRDKVENQIPKDLNEISAKQERMKHQLNSRMDKEEEERYLAIKELQDAFQRLQTQNGGVVEQGGTSLQKDVDDVKTAIKKLAESVTTVKNVLDQKITNETKAREQDVKRLQNTVGEER